VGAENGHEALALIDAGGRFDLLFTDIGLPDGMLGHELAALAVERQAGIKVLFTTGYAQIRRSNIDERNEPRPMIRKPYRGRELADMVRSILD
jgi:CheY-like chemotaxis protein